MEIGRKIAITSAAIYTAISLTASVLFLGAATLTGQYTAVARIGGAVWILLLSFIVTMPLVTSAVKKRMKA
ncbi:MAG: hypothetical protein A3G81_02765 [Betaproteobacteria bacterium RIFCSPLOWO2_12_FULL_65_14]|nr:MAG: hypothetical protein A3G81_02765 [Betaproteobacteria bacterium RIFCSPLOWO2_12_FULL_65_14]